MQYHLSSLAFGITIAGFPLVSVELLSRRFGLGAELTRKLVHAASGIAVACLPLFLSLHEIALIAACFLVLMLTMRRGRTWHSLYRVNRRSWGEICFPVSVGLAAVLAPSSLAFVASMLVMGLADTAAAGIGGAYGTRHWPWSSGKTYLGSLACFLVALVICLVMTRLGLANVRLALLASLLATLAESITPYGLDNLTMPLVVLAVIH